jgi:hypothetical protein
VDAERGDDRLRDAVHRDQELSDGTVTGLSHQEAMKAARALAKSAAEPRLTVRARIILERVRALGIVMPTDKQQTRRLTAYFKGHGKVGCMFPPLAKALQKQFAGRCTTDLTFFRSINRMTSIPCSSSDHSPASDLPAPR